MRRHLLSLFVASALATLALFPGCGDPPTLCCGLPGCPVALPNDGDACSLSGVVVGMGEAGCDYCSAPDSSSVHGDVTDIAYCRNGAFEVESVSDVQCMVQ